MSELMWTGTNYEKMITSGGLHNTSGYTLSTGGILSGTFTAPSTSIAATGITVYLAAIPSVGDIQFELLRSGSPVAGVTWPLADMVLGFNHLRFSTPHTFTTTTAGAYQCRASKTTINNGQLGANVPANGFWFRVTTSDTATPTVGDDVWVCGFYSSGLTPKTLTLTGTANSWGAGVEKSASPSMVRTSGAALTIGNGGTVTFDTTASTTLQLRGMLTATAGGVFDMRGHTSDITKVNTLAFDCETANNNYGLHTGTGPVGGDLRLTGKTVAVIAHYQSGLGTTADPVVTTTPHGFTIGDELVIGGSAYNENEVRFVTATPTATSLVWSATKGGGDAALANTHLAGCHIANMTRNVIVRAVTATRGYWMYNATTTATPDFSYCRLENPSCSSGAGLNLAMNPAGSSTADGLVIYGSSVAGRQSVSISSAVAASFNDWILFDTLGSNYSGQSGVQLSGATGKTFDGIYGFAAPGSTAMCGVVSLATGSTGNTLRNVHSYGANASNNGSFGYAVGVFASNRNRFEDCSINGTRGYGLRLDSGVGNRFVDCTFGTLGANGSDIGVNAALSDALFERCTFASPSLISGMAATFDGSEWRFHEMDGNTDKHLWWTNRGAGSSTGAGLPDTTTRTGGSLAVALSPTDATVGLEWSFKIPANPESQVSIFGYARRNAAFSAGDCTVDLYLPGSDTPDASYPIPLTTDAWLPFNLAAYYAGSEARYATVTITAKSNVVGATLYIDDLYDAGTANKVAGLDVWDNGKPSPIMVAADYSAIAAQVWGYPTGGTVTATMGDVLATKTAQVADLLAIE